MCRLSPRLVAMLAPFAPRPSRRNLTRLSPLPLGYFRCVTSRSRSAYASPERLTSSPAHRQELPTGAPLALAQCAGPAALSTRHGRDAGRARAAAGLRPVERLAVPTSKFVGTATQADVGMAAPGYVGKDTFLSRCQPQYRALRWSRAQ